MKQHVFCRIAHPFFVVCVTFFTFRCHLSKKIFLPADLDGFFVHVETEILLRDVMLFMHLISEFSTLKSLLSFYAVADIAV